jgi:hypothetical protein
MAKWAKFLISEVRYSPDRKRILEVKQHKDLDGSVGEGEIVPRDIVSSNLKKGITYCTIHSGSSENWKMGNKIRTFIVDGEYFIRSDKNKVNRDNLGLLNEF